MSECRLCGNSAKLVKSHSIPEAFFREANLGPDIPRLYFNQEGQHPKRSPVGVYDRFVCSSCEKKFQDWDQYAIELLVSDFDKFENIIVDQELSFFLLEQFDYTRLKLFFISVLWRSHESTQSFYEEVHLGRYADIARTAVESGNAGGLDFFSVVLSRWDVSDERKKLAKIIVSPFREKWDNVNAYRFYFGMTVAYIKVDKRPFPPELRSVSLAMDSKLLCVAREFDTSKDFDTLKRLANDAYRR